MLIWSKITGYIKIIWLICTVIVIISLFCLFLMRPLFGRLKVLSHATCYGSFLLFLRLYFRDWNRFLLSVNATVGKDWHGLKLKKVGPTLLSFNLYLQIKITKNKTHCYCFLVKFVWYRFVNFLKKRYRVILCFGKRTKQWMSSAQNWPKTYQHMYLQLERLNKWVHNPRSFIPGKLVLYISRPFSKFHSRPFARRSVYR